MSMQVGGAWSEARATAAAAERDGQQHAPSNIAVRFSLRQMAHSRKSGVAVAAGAWVVASSTRAARQHEEVLIELARVAKMSLVARSHTMR